MLDRRFSVAPLDGLDGLSGKSKVRSALNHGRHQPCCTKCSTDTGQKYPRASNLVLLAFVLRLLRSRVRLPVVKVRPGC
jgi:hypothetical protein